MVVTKRQGLRNIDGHLKENMTKKGSEKVVGREVRWIEISDDLTGKDRELLLDKGVT